MSQPVTLKAYVVKEIFYALDCNEPLTMEFIKIVLTDIALFDRKQHDRGPENIARHGERGALLRMWDKLARVNTIVWEGRQPVISEPVEAEWADLSVYGVIARMCRAGVWPGAPSQQPAPPVPTAVGIGTKVRLVRSGVVGKVILISPENSAPYLVEFEKEIPQGHSGGRPGLTYTVPANNGNCWWFNTVPGETEGLTVELV